MLKYVFVAFSTWSKHGLSSLLKWTIYVVTDTLWVSILLILKERYY